MSSHRRGLLRLCLVAALAGILCLPGCRKQKSADDNSASDKPAEPVTKRAEYVNDLDRLGQLTERVNRACRGGYVTVLGADGSTADGLVCVDYALFDKLSDDGAAVLIAEAIAARPKSTSQIQSQVSIERVILQADEAVGRYIARAGFSSGGFAEWLEVKKLSAAGSQQNGVPEKARIAAFMRGYSSERYSKKDR